MYKKLFIAVLLGVQGVYAQIPPLGGVSPQATTPDDPVANNAIKFDFDTAGNQTKRHLIYLSAGQGKQLSGDDSREISEGLIDDMEYGDISYYPNPVRSELYVQWEKDASHEVQKIYLYDLSGRQINYFPNMNGLENITIDFQPYPAGIYSVNLIYNTGKLKTLKIVKP